MERWARAGVTSKRLAVPPRLTGTLLSLEETQE